jgi:hypothetical protein
MRRDLRIRVTVADNGKAFKRELVYGDDTVCEMTPTDIIEFIMQATSSLRYDVPKLQG